MLKRIALALIPLLGFAVMATAQNKQISGKVTDANGDPIPELPFSSKALRPV